MNSLAARLAGAMLAVALLALLVFGGALLTAVQVTGRSVPQVARDPALGPPPRPDRLAGPGDRPLPLDEQARRDQLRRDQERAGQRVFEAVVRSARQAALLGVLAAAVLGLLVALWLARSLARPIGAVGQAAQAVAGGQLGARAPPARPSDPAETRALIADFNAMTHSLEQADRQRRALFADVAHELRTPIAAMQARLESLQDGLAPLDATQLDRLHAQASHLARLVEDVRTLSLADAGELTLRPGLVEVGPFLEGVAEQYAPLLQARGQTLKLHLAPDLGTATWDAARITQILGNLLDNAIKASPEGGWVDLGATRDADVLTIAVADSGPGLSDEALAHAFDRFYKSDMGGAAGSGLGLAIVHTLAELHGGRVEGGHHPAGGAVFRVTLPAAPRT